MERAREALKKLNVLAQMQASMPFLRANSASDALDGGSIC
jgi:hypothetical protein